MRELIFPFSKIKWLITVSGRELHKRLRIETQYTKWIGRMIGYGFEENVDYILVSQKSLTNNPRNPYTNQTDHITSSVGGQNLFPESG
ncbi:hypothetical protein CD132_01525 [Staphylococcus microti]|nr:hypothetical protein CD132_01525 [Staphylococcus microti]